MTFAKQIVLDNLNEIIEFTEKFKQLKASGEISSRVKYLQEVLSDQEITDQWTIVPKQGIELYTDDELLAEIKNRFHRCCVPMA